MFSVSGQQRNNCLECCQSKWDRSIVHNPIEKMDQRSQKTIQRSFSFLVVYPQHTNTVTRSPELKISPEIMGRQTHMWMQIVTNRPQPVNNKLTHTCQHVPVYVQGVCVCARACVRACCIVCLFGKRQGWKGIPYDLLCFLPAWVHVSASVLSSSHCLLTASPGRARQHL